MKRITSITGAAVAAALVLPAGALAARGDRNHDGMPDRWEHRYHVTSATADPDHDGLPNLAEYRSGTNPNVADTNHNGVPDGEEDRDHDHVDNGNEVLEGTDPGRVDTDRDGIPDGQEDADHDGLSNAAEDEAGTSPVDADSDDDGVPDGAEITGTVVRFADGVLVIRSANGSEVSGTVTADTEIGCDTEGDYDDANSASAASVRAASGRAAASDQDEDGEPGKPAGNAPAPGTSAADDAGAGEQPCSVDDLVPGAIVHDAELTASPEGATFTQVELVVH